MTREPHHDDSRSPQSAVHSPTKGLYRRLDVLIGARHVRERGEAFVVGALRDVFERFSAEFSLTSAAAFVANGTSTEWITSLGDPSGGLTSSGELVPRQPNRVFLLAQGDACVAHFTVITVRRPCTLVFGFAPRTLWPRVEVLLNTIASILALRLVEEQLGTTLAEAAEIQRSLLPSEAPSFPGFDIAARCEPASEVGGDWFDYLPLGEGSLGLAIGDASGHGLPAALMARDVVIGLRMGIERELKAGYALSKLNRVIHASALTSRFVSLFYGELEENGSFFYYNAGHERALVVDASGTKELGSGDPVIGPLPEVRFRRRFEHLDRGALLALYTDGVIERRAADGALFGLERLKSLLEEGRHRPAAELVAQCFDAIERFGSSDVEKDDATLVIVRRSTL